MGTRPMPSGGRAGPITPSTRYASYLHIFLLIELFVVFSKIGNTAEVNPLRPVDTASPRETLQDFVVTMDGIYRGTKDILQEYAAIAKTVPHFRRTAQTGRGPLCRSKGDQGSGPFRYSPCAPTDRRRRAGDPIKGDTRPDRASFFRQCPRPERGRGSAVKAVAAAGDGDRHCAYRERTAFRRISRLRRHGGSPPRVLRTCQETALQARPGSRIERCLSQIEHGRHRDDLRGLYEFPSRIGAHRADPLDAELAGLGQIPDRRGCIMAVARLPGRARRLPGICLRDISPEPAISLAAGQRSRAPAGTLS